MKPILNLIAVVVISATALHAENWTGFRGPTHQGLSIEAGLPLHWSATENIAWKCPIPGESWSSPIIWSNQVFVTTATDNGTSCRVLALNLQTGKILWNQEVFKQAAGHKQDRNTYATPTPCTDGERVYAVFGDGSFVALNFQGQIVWVNRDYPFYSEHGLATSPLLWEDLLIMARDGSGEGANKTLGWQIPWDKSFLLALDKKTGKPCWKTGRGLSRIAHVCPNLWTNAEGKVQIISGAGDVVQGFDARSGERIWTSKNIGEGVVPSIVLGDGLAFTASGWGGKESIKAFRLDSQGNLGETNLIWEQRKAMPHIPSYLYIKPYLYTINESGTAMCLKGDTGEIVWQERLPGNYSASPVSSEGHIYFLSDQGVTTVIEAAPQFKLLARNSLDERAQASIAIAHGHLLIRAAQNLYCIGKN